MGESPVVTLVRIETAICQPLYAWEVTSKLDPPSTLVRPSSAHMITHRAIRRSHFASTLCEWYLVRPLFPVMAMSKLASAASACASVPSERNHKASSNQQEMFLAESIRTEPIFASTVPMRVPVQKKSRYHRYGKSTGMKAVGRSKAYSYSRRDQCQLIKEVWENVDDLAISHRCYKRMGLVHPPFHPIDIRPEIQPMSHSGPMYASLTSSHFVSSQQLFKEAGRKLRHRKVSLEDMRHRLQAFWKDMVRISWIHWFNETLAMSWVFFGDQTYVSYDEKPAWCYNTGIGYKPQVREIAAQPTSSRPQVEQFDEIPYRFQAREQPRRIHLGEFGTAFFNRGGQGIMPLHVHSVAEDICTSVPAGEDYESQVIYLDMHAAHVDPSVAELMESKGHVLFIHGGGMTPNEQINDTNLHQKFKKGYKK